MGYLILVLGYQKTYQFFTIMYCCDDVVDPVVGEFLHCYCLSLTLSLYLPHHNPINPRHYGDSRQVLFEA